MQGRNIVLIGGPNSGTLLDEMHTDTIILPTGKYEATGFFTNGREEFRFKENPK